MRGGGSRLEGRLVEYEVGCGVESESVSEFGTKGENCSEGDSAVGSVRLR